ncbi:MAG TPA: PAS domain S-box protein [Terriglobales bacterium]|nr:PAS domain S-box protein [Terriglobales bacterium]
MSGWLRESLPVRYNAGLCFVFCGLALLLLVRSRFTLSHLAAAATFVIGLLTTCEYVFVFNSGIDQIFFDSTRVAPSVPARMAPNAAVCFLILGGVLLIASKKPGRARNALQAFAAALVASVSLAGLIGYVVDVPTAYSWGNLTPFAAPTAVGMLALAAGIVAFAWGQSTSRFDATPPWSALLAGMAVTTVSVALWQALNALQAEPAISWLTLAVGLLQAALLYMALHLLRSTRERARQLRQLNSTLQKELAERERAEKSLRYSEERYRALLVAIAQVVWSTPPDGLVEDMPMWREYTGQSLEQVRAWGWLNTIHPDDRERTAAIWSKAVETRGLYETEYRIRRADGQYRHFAIRGVPVLKDDGSIREWVGICTDIHQRKQIEDELRKQATLLNLAHDAIVVRDLQGHILFWNRGAAETYGWTAEEASGRLIHELLRTTSTRPLADVEAAVQQEGEWEGELQHIIRDGRTIVVASRCSLQRDHHGAPASILEINRDITERKRLEEELRARQAYTRSLIEASLDPLVTIAADGKITDVNSATETVTGCVRQELIGTDFCNYFTEPEKARTGYQQVFAEGLVQDYPLVIRHRFGRVTDVVYNASIFRNEAGDAVGVFAAARDITERKRLEDSLRQRTLELENSVAELEAFSYSVSHDLRAPLRSIDGFSQILLEDYSDKVDAEGQDSLRRIRNASQNMAQLIDALLQLSRVMRSELCREPVDLSILALSTAALIQKAEPARRVRFHVANGLQGQGDRRLLGVALQNLLQNAWKFSARNPEPTVEFGSMHKDGKTAYYVRDNGIGFDMTYIDKLFTPFQRLHAKEQFDGTGIGLATVKRVIKRHGGRVWAEGVVGKGATFYFSLD